MVKKNSSNAAAIRSLGLAILSVTLFSLSAKVGLDSFTIYLNDKLLVRQYVTREADVQTFTLEAGSPNDVLKVHYDHCGKIGTDRSMALQDGRKKVLKRWSFSDSAPAVMDVRAKELFAFRKDAGRQGLQLVYSSREIPDGKVLASLILSDESKARLD